MEQSSQSSAQKIEFLLGQINTLLEKNGYVEWAAYGKEWLDNFVNLTHSKTKKEAAIEIKRALTSGMGGFRDIVFYKDDKVLIEENNEIRRLWTLLFEQCELLQYERLSARKADTFINSQYHTAEIEMDNYYIVYRVSSREGSMGQFFIDKPVFENQEAGAHKIYSLKIPKGTLVRMGNVVPIEGSLLKGQRQIYIEKPWKIQGFENIFAEVKA